MKPVLSHTRQACPRALSLQARMPSHNMPLETQIPPTQDSQELTNPQPETITIDSTLESTARSKIIRTTKHNKRPLEELIPEELEAPTIKRNKQNDKKQTAKDSNNNDSMDDSIYYDSEINMSGIISDDCREQQSTSSSRPTLKTINTDTVETQNNKTYIPTTAKIDLNANLENLPQTALQVFIHNATEDKKLATINPYKIKAEIDTLCGPVNNVEHRRNGSLLITTKSTDQVQTIVKSTRLPISQIPIKGSVAWSTQTVSGKIYAPEFAEDTLSDLLELLKPVGVIAIRKFLQDPTKKHIPIYVLTFLNNKCPDKIQVGYTRYRVDEYYSQPLRCTNCCKWGHSQRNCHGRLTCGRCAQQGHHQKDCSSDTSSCPNCKEDHPVNSKRCVKFKEQQNLCRIKSTLNISYQEARKKMNDEQTNKLQLQHTIPQMPNTNTQIPPDTQSEETFPRYINKQARHPGQMSNTQNLQINHPTTQTTYHTLITPSQQTQTNSPTTGYNETPLSLELPPLSPQYCLPGTIANKDPETLKTNSNNTQNQRTYANTTKNQPPQNNNKENPKNQRYDVREIIVKLLPLLIKLLLSNNTTDKIECFIEIGVILQAENTITEALANLGTTSISPTTQT